MTRVLFALLLIVPGPVLAQDDASPTKYDELLAKADAKLADGDYGEAVRFYQEASHLETGKARPIVGIARCGFDQAVAAGDAKGLMRVRALLREALTRERDDAGALFLWGELCLVEGNHAGAVQAFRTAVLKDYRSREARALLAKSLLWLGADLAAEERLTNEQIIEVFEDAERSLRILSRDEDYTEKEHREFELMRRKALLNLAAMHQRAKDLPRAEKIIRELIELEPKNAERWYTLGLLLGFSGREEEAIAAYEKALELNDDPDWVVPCRPLGHLKSVGGDVEAADKLLRRFVEKRSDSWNGWLTWGDHLFRNSRFDEAAGAFERCVEIGPDGRDAVRKLYRALRRAGRSAEAEKWGQLFRLLDAETE